MWNSDSTWKIEPSIGIGSFWVANFENPIRFWIQSRYWPHDWNFTLEMELNWATSENQEYYRHRRVSDLWLRKSIQILDPSLNQAPKSIDKIDLTWQIGRSIEVQGLFRQASFGYRIIFPIRPRFQSSLSKFHVSELAKLTLIGVRHS